MKRRPNHFEREAWIMALLLPIIVVFGVFAGFVLPWLSRVFGWHPH